MVFFSMSGEGYEKNYSPENKYLWDPWFIKVDGEYHLFHLQAPKDTDPTPLTVQAETEFNLFLRSHNLSSIGHAKSSDLKTWEELPTALSPLNDSPIEDLALWTGSVIEKDKKYYLFYTARAKKDYWMQTICLATSDDLIEWKRYKDNPILTADNRFYQMQNKQNKIGGIPAWRDPFVFYDESLEKYFMTITARTRGETPYNGCVALAESSDLVNWIVHRPILAPKIYESLEIPQIIFHDDYYYLFFSTHDPYEEEWVDTNGLHQGLHCYYSKELFGGYAPVNKNGHVHGDDNKVYGLRIADKKKDKYLAMGFLNEDEEGKFVGKLSDVYEIEIDKDKVRLLVPG